jgi:hypothetical protein
MLAAGHASSEGESSCSPPTTVSNHGRRGGSRLLPQLDPPASVLRYLAALLTDLAERGARHLQVSSAGVHPSGGSAC